jgi:hypothetical protein
VRPSLSTFDAALAAFGEVCFLGAFVWDKALPAADFEAFPVDLLVNVFDAFFAAFGLVIFLFAIFPPFDLFFPHFDHDINVMKGYSNF